MGHLPFKQGTILSSTKTHSSNFSLVLADLIHAAVDICQSSDDVINLLDDTIILGYEGGHIEDELVHSITSRIEKQVNATNCRVREGKPIKILTRIS